MNTSRTSYIPPSDEKANAYQARLGYSRAVRRGPLIHVSGSTSYVDGATQHVGSAYKQAVAAFETSLEAISHLCAPELAAEPDLDVRRYVTRIKMFVRKVEDCEAVGEAMRDVFKAAGNEWASTLLAGIVLVAEEMLVEVELDAWVA